MRSGSNAGLAANTTNLQIRLARRPDGTLAEDDFQLVDGTVPRIGAGELLVHVRYLSTDPANRVYMKRKTYRDQVQTGEIMGGFAIAEVLESAADGFAPGDLVFGDTGWQEFARVAASAMLKMPRVEPLSHLVSVYGITAGYTAFIGLGHFGHLASGETVVVSGAAGAVGSMAGQIARLRGCRVIGIAGGAEKCRVLTEEFRIDASIDYKADDLDEALARFAPEGIDVYFDNVGGETSQACARHMRRSGRIVLCGAISGYDSAAAPETGISPRKLANVSITRFLVLDYLDQYPDAFTQMAAWVAAGDISVREDIVVGLENAPAALIGLLGGGNIGKRMVKVS
jgi:NADPH-dependent curcumin reductase CurA